MVNSDDQFGIYLSENVPFKGEIEMIRNYQYQGQGETFRTKETACVLKALIKGYCGLVLLQEKGEWQELE